MRCIECEKEAEWVRYTQFCGKHPYCEEHAKMEEDFQKDGGSYFFWGKPPQDEEDKK